ncbi:MAG: hypothetical protein HOO98_07160 [Nitrospira sp.]|nr:hypothetical protein [Nitrospira sp.]
MSISVDSHNRKVHLLVVTFTALSIWLVTNAIGEEREPMPRNLNGDQTAPTISPSNPKRFQTSLDAASSALETIKSPGYFANDPEGLEYAKNLGFQSLDEIKYATLGNPIPVKHFRLKKLQNYKSKEDLGGLLTDSHETIYPIYVHGAVRSSVTVSVMGMGGDWKWIATGAPKFTQELEQVHAQVKDKEPFLVQNRALGLRFLGAFRNKELKLFSLSPKTLLLLSNQIATLFPKEGEEASADDVFKALAPISKELLTREDFKNPHSRRKGDLRE